MGRGGAGCVRCGGQNRQLSAKSLVAVCAECRGSICNKHVTWNSEAGTYLCTACDRKRG